MDWNPQLYLKYKNERTQPSIDLVSRIDLAAPATIIDIGCGPGNSTQILVNRWPEAEVVGLDSSASMIEKALADFPGRQWLVGDAAKLTDENRDDLVFSNATLQWIPDHETLVPALLRRARKDGALAVQVPRFDRMSIGDAIAIVAGRESWKSHSEGIGSLFTFHDASFYYDRLVALANRIDLWETTYVHILESHRALIEFCRGAGLKPYLDALPTDGDRARFEEEVLEEVVKVYPQQADGKVLFPFRRLFFIAYRQ
jgi:trans-aconitate 2-methyltransferase